MIFSLLSLCFSKATPITSTKGKADEVLTRVKAFDDVLTGSLIDDKDFVGALSKFASVLSNETTRPYTVNLSIRYDLSSKLFDRLDLVNVRCSEKRFMRYVFYIVSSLRELVVFGGERVFTCRMEALLNTIEECNDLGVFRVILYYIVTSITFPKGGLCLSGAGPRLTQFISKFPYGQVDWSLLSIYAIWADRMNPLHPKDKAAMCSFADRLIENRGFWDTDTKTHFCWLMKNLDCPAFDSPSLSGLMQDPVCKEFLRQTEVVIGQQEL